MRECATIVSDASTFRPTPGEPHLSGQELARIVGGDLIVPGEFIWVR